MRRVHVPVARRLVAQAHAMGARAQSSAASSSASAAPTIRIRSRGYGPSRDLLRGIPEDAVLSVEATLHPEDAEIQRAVLALAMPSLAEVHVTPVMPHDSYANNKVPQRAGASYGGGDVLTSTEREVMEQCLQEQLSDVANLVVEKVGQRTGQQLDALQVTHADELRNFAEIILHGIQDELRQLRLARGAAQGGRGEGGGNEARPALPPSTAAAALDVEAVAQVVSAKVMERLAGVTAPVVAAAAATTTPGGARSAEAVLEDLERRTAAYFEQLQARVQSAVSSGTAAATTRVDPEAIDELRAAAREAVETASATQQEHLAGLVNDWLADMARTPVGSSGSVAASVDRKALEDMVESAVQTSTNELRHIITSEVKKLGKAKKTSSGGSSDEGVDLSELVVEVEKVFDVMKATQSRLAAVDEVVGDVFKEQASTRDALQSIQDLLKQLSEVRAAPPTDKTPPSVTGRESSSSATDSDPSASSTIKAVEEAVASLQRQVAAAQSQATIYQEEAQQQLLTVAQVVSDSVSAAMQQHTAEAVQSAMATVQQQLDALAATAQASADAAAAAAAATDARAEPAMGAPAPTFEPLSKEVLADAIESVLTPRWSTLSTEVERMNTANQQAIEQQLLHMANSVAASVTASLQEQLEAAHIRHEGVSAAAAADKTETAAVYEAEMQKRAAAAEAAVVSAATTLADKTTQQLTSFREELMSTIQAEMLKSHSVDLTPMYKYIDSVLTFMKEELSIQETSLATKMTSLTDTVMAAIQKSQERPLLHAGASAEPSKGDGETELSSSSSLRPAQSKTAGASSSGDAATASPAEGEDKPAAEAAASGAPSPPVTVEVPASLTNAIDLQTGALRHLEEQLNKLSLTQSRDMSMLLTRLQEATAEFRAATSVPPSPAPLHADQLAWQGDVKAQLTALEESLEKRDADLLAAVRASAMSSDVKAQLTQLEDTFKSSSAAQRKEWQTALHEIVHSNTQEQSSRVDTLVRRVAEMQGTLHDQAVAVQLLRPSPALRGLTAEQRQAQARIHTATQERLRRLTQILEEVTHAGQHTDVSGAAAAHLQAELQQLRQLQEEETALHRDIAASASAADAESTVESIVRTEVIRAQTAVQDSIGGFTSHYDEAHKELATTLNALLAGLSDVNGNTSGIPSIADIQQLLDATLVRLKEDQRDAQVHITQLVAESTRTAAAELTSVVKSTMSESIAASVEQQMIPAYHGRVEASLQTRLSEHASAVTAAVTGVEGHTTAVVGKVESLVRDLHSQRALDTQRILAAQHGKHERLEVTKPQARMPLWWMLVNALLVCAVVLLSFYYVFACLLLAFVPKPSEEALGQESSHSGNNIVEGDAERGSGVDSDQRLRRGGRYVDRYM
ncbi:hypothetical protein ABL78_4836 [Leptomonas seymouri]|uniref:Uncharacterized protein n=1 Tax=Leptomonas seymouri TaxID=5684 RepID=A0A0N0P568_LEPSE|nr:hypothetical protein ABL78_4836 [Leptomonas seymouri]|eukprot:KPI86109.1 hypothetical protein ABL78_4836 [Leptomonas seymouri]